MMRIVTPLLLSLSLMSPTSYLPKTIPNSLNQYSSNNCWAFSTAACLEQSILAAGGELNEHLSVVQVHWAREHNLPDPLHLNDGDSVKTYNHQGGTFQDTMMEVVNGNVPITESRITDWDSLSHLTPYDVKWKCERALFVDPRDAQEMKKCIRLYGGVCIGINTLPQTMLNTLYSCGTKSLYNKQGITHGIVIIGWDDTISANKFQPLAYEKNKFVHYEEAPQNGAWICKNSWGDYHEFQNEASSLLTPGCFYLSYTDAFSIMSNNYGVTYKLRDKVDYTNTYQYDNVAYASFIPGKSFANTFTISGIYSKYERVDEVGIFVGRGGCYKIYINDDRVINCALPNAGFYHIKTNLKKVYTKGQKVTIKVTERENREFVMECARTTNTPYEVKNKSFTGVSEINDAPLVDEDSEITPCIKMYTSSLMLR